MNKCLVCKKSFTPKSHTTGKYCSHLCSSKARIGSHTKGHPAWNKGLRFADYPEIRLEPTNGITICTKCDYQWVFRNEPEWENYFNFNLTNRGIL